MKRLNVKHRVVIGLIGLTISVVMLAAIPGTALAEVLQPSIFSRMVSYT